MELQLYQESQLMTYSASLFHRLNQ